MYQYEIWRHPSGSVAATRDGWSWSAFLLSFVWALYSGIWLLGLVVLGALIILGVELGLDDIGLGIMQYFLIIAMLLCGFFGNRLLKARLRARGYRREFALHSWNARAAIQRFTQLGQ